LNFASHCFASKQKLLNRSEAKNLKGKKAKKSNKNGKKQQNKKKHKKQKNRLEFRFALFHIETKITKVKRSENLKRSKQKEAKKEK
jgi:hypothetical protein